MPDPPRIENGHLVYDDTTLARLRFARRAQAAGLTVAKIANVIHVGDDDITQCSHVNSLGSAADLSTSHL